jgi:uncharacterized membrane protein YbhN (UPF0104 family)
VIRRLFANRSLRRILQALVTLVAFAYLAKIVDRHALLQALDRMPAWALCSALCLTALSLGLGVLRWWLLFRAFGAPRPPRLIDLAKHYLVGLFYNTYLPGAVTGDVVRGLAAQNAWEPGSAGGFATVVVERVFGLVALLGLTASTLLVHPLPGLSGMWLPAAAACALALATALLIACTGFAARYAPRALRGVFERIPVPTSWLPLAAALLMSVGTQLCPALCGHILVQALWPSVAWLDSLVIVPLAAAAAFLPFTISGIGVRESVFVQLYARVGVPGQVALAASISLWLTQALLAAVGGIYTLLHRPADHAREQRPAG